MATKKNSVWTIAGVAIVGILAYMFLTRKKAFASGSGAGSAGGGGIGGGLPNPFSPAPPARRWRGRGGFQPHTPQTASTPAGKSAIGQWLYNFTRQQTYAHDTQGQLETRSAAWPGCDSVPHSTAGDAG